MTAKRVTSVSSPFQVVSSRKRHLSLLEEGSVEKSKSEGDLAHDLKRQSVCCIQSIQN